MRKPPWLRTRLPSGSEFEAVNARLHAHGLNTVCSSARCPNLADCWGRGTATFLILGDTCTRHCKFCSVKTGNPHGKVDETEPQRVADAVAELRLKYVVLTSVDRDDLVDLGARPFARTVSAVRSITHASLPRRVVEVLTPDFAARPDLVGQVVDSGPDVFGHNIETVERLSLRVRDPRAAYRLSLDVLETAKKLKPAMTTKSSLLVGLGETHDELKQAMRDLRAVGCDIVTIGQYLRPARNCLPVERYVVPDEFAVFQAEAHALGFRHAFCGPLVRSSFHAEDVFLAQNPEPPVA